MLLNMIGKFIAGLCIISMPAGVYAQEIVSEPALALSNTEETFSLPQEEPPTAMPGGMYKMNYKVDIPVIAAGTAWSLYAFGKIYSKDPSSLAEIQALNKNDINGFDRWAAGKSSDAADAASNYLFYGSIPAPFLLLADKQIRKDAPKVGMMYWEAMAITGLLYTGSTYFVDRYRPETYDLSIPAQDRTNGNYKNSFLAGHVALVATSTFFTAKVYSDYHPSSTLSWVIYGGAAAATGTTIYLRHIAGKHFPTDLIAGTAVGVLSGILVPHFHKNKVRGSQAFNITPYMQNEVYGLTLKYTMK
jgi:hypothetical protein